ncbi:MAG TPA: hypothetical protein VD838_13880, partial [Anaeromyxobacteraceae bacterium]|nr:hypothetical protein [Anaeromyxobacteraceae bacterium]
PDRARVRRAARSLALASLVVLVAGFLLARSGDALAEQTGLGASFVGFLMGGAATTLPELSSTLAAVRLRQYELAFSDAFGTNQFSVMVLCFVDLAYRGGPVLNEVGPFATVAALLGLLLTAVYVIGIVGRRKRTVLRMGSDSLLVLVTAAGGLALLFSLR